MLWLSNLEWMYFWPFFNEPSFLSDEKDYEEEREELVSFALFSGQEYSAFHIVS